MRENGLYDDATYDKLNDGIGDGTIQIVKNSDLKKVTITPRTIVIWDEAHYAQTKEQRPHEMFTRSGLSVNGTEESRAQWAEKDCYLLLVSATPFAQFCAFVHDPTEIDIPRVILPPGDGYRGVKWYMDNGLLHESVKMSKEEKGQKMFQDVIARHADSRKYVFGRWNDAADRDCARTIAGMAGYDIMEYDATRSNELTAKVFEEAPENPTLVILKGCFRMGKVLPKPHIAAVWEGGKTGQTDTILQSLLGRCCGYQAPDAPGIEIYVPFCVLEAADGKSYNELDRYIGFYNGEVVVPLKTGGTHGGKADAEEADEAEHQVPFVPFEISADEDAQSACDAIRDIVAKHKGKKNALRLSAEDETTVLSLVKDYIMSHPDAMRDEVQRDFVLDLLHTQLTERSAAPRSIGFRNGHAKSYETEVFNLRKHMEMKSPCTDIKKSDRVKNGVPYHVTIMIRDDGILVNGWTYGASTGTIQLYKAAHMPKPVDKSVQSKLDGSIQTYTTSTREDVLSWFLSKIASIQRPGGQNIRIPKMIVDAYPEQHAKFDEIAARICGGFSTMKKAQGKPSRENQGFVVQNLRLTMNMDLSKFVY